MALSEWDKKHLTGGQQRAIVAYTQQYDSAMAAGNRNAAQKAHESAEAIRKQAGWTGGATGAAAPPAAPDFQAAQSSTNIFTKYGLTENGRKQTTPLTTERADELDKRNVESASRQAAKRSALDHEIEWQARAFGTGEANTFLSTGGAAHSGSGRSFGPAAGRGVGGHSGGEAPKSVADQIALREQSRGDSSLDERLRNILSGSMKLYGAQGVGVAEAAANVEQAYRQARPQSYERDIERTWTPPTPESVNEQAQRIQRFGSKLKASGAADVERAQEGLNRLGRFGVNAGVAVTQMGADVGLGLLTGGGSMLPMAARSFGGGVQEAREKGYSVKQQLGIGLANAATECVTEKLFGGNPAYDRSAGWVNQAVDRLTRNKTWNTKLMNALSSLPADMLSEGLEEVLADIVEPAAEWAITGNRPAYELDQIVEDGLTGVLLSAAGKGGQYVTNAVRNGHLKAIENAEKSTYNTILNENGSRGGAKLDGVAGTGLEVTEDEKFAIFSYKSSESYKINEALRGGRELTPLEQTLVKNLDGALEKLPEYSGTVYRNVSFDDFGEDAYKRFLSCFSVGEPISFLSYISTSMSEAGHPMDGEYVVNLVIEGTSGRRLAGFGNNFEQEVLFRRNAYFLPTAITTGTDGHPLIKLTEVHGNGQRLGQANTGRLEQDRGRNQTIREGLPAKSGTRSPGRNNERRNLSDYGGTPQERNTIKSDTSSHYASALREAKQGGKKQTGLYAQALAKLHGTTRGLYASAWREIKRLLGGGE